MNPLAVDLRSRPLPPRGAWIALAVLVLAASGAVTGAVMIQRQLEVLRAREVSLLQHGAAPPRVPWRATTPVTPYDASARVALGQAQAGWVPLLRSLESVEVLGVTVAGIDVSADERQVRVELEYSDFAGLLRFLDDLNAGADSPPWQLVQAQGSPRAAAPTGAPIALSVATVRGAW